MKSPIWSERLASRAVAAYDFDHMFEDPFNHLSPEASRTITLAKGDHVFRQGARSSGLFRVVSGEVTLQRHTESGHAIVLHKALASTLFAEASIYSEHYHCDAIATVRSVIERFERGAVLAALDSNPAFATSFTRLLAHQVQSSRQLIELKSIRSAEARVLAALELGLLDGPVTEFAARIGLTHEACYRALRGLVQAGLVTKTGRGQYAARG